MLLTIKICFQKRLSWKFFSLKKADCLRWPFKVTFAAKEEKNYKDKDYSNLKPDKKTSFSKKKFYFDLKRLEHNVVSNEFTVYTVETNKHEYFHQYYRRIYSVKMFYYHIYLFKIL